MTGSRLAFLKDAFPNHDVRIMDDGLHAIIFNPFCGENANVYYYEDDDFTPFVACYSFQHCHLTDEESVVEWINEIIEGKKFAIEFFSNGRNRFGGDIEAEELEHISYERLEQYTGYFGVTKLLELVDSFKVRGWRKENDFDAVFVLDADGTVAIEKHIAL